MTQFAMIDTFNFIDIALNSRDFFSTEYLFNNHLQDWNTYRIYNQWKSIFLDYFYVYLVRLIKLKTSWI